MIIKRKLYSKYDDTDEIKRMKDSDILDAQEKKLDRLERIIRTLKNTGNKAIIGGVAGGGSAAARYFVIFAVYIQIEAS